MNLVRMCISGEIHSESVSPLIMEALNTPPEWDIELVIIDSPGGDLMAALALMEAMMSRPKRIRTVGLGRVESAAALLFLLGRPRILGSKSLYMLHAPTVTALYSPLIPYIEGQVINLVRTLTGGNRHLESLARMSNPQVLTGDEMERCGAATNLLDIGKGWTSTPHFSQFGD